jgi:hypothetical protein
MDVDVATCREIKDEVNVGDWHSLSRSLGSWFDVLVSSSLGLVQGAAVLGVYDNGASTT